MARPIEDLPKIFRKVRLSVERQFNEGVQNVAMAGGRTMVKATRVDTGKARSNYIATLDNPNTGEIPPYFPGIKLGFDETANLSAATNQHRRVSRRYRTTKNMSIFISNNVRYIGFLNDGSFNISPPGMMLELGVQSAILAAKRIRLIKGRTRLVPVRGSL
jgi:hypothetical protein